MSVLYKLSICGVRSFGPNSEEQITFSTPVTLFLGQNGCGKTTIIEAIKYACTGEIPAGTNNGKGFLNDPNLSNKNTTKGSVRIKFFDHQGNEITVGRFMQVIIKGNTPTFKTLLPQVKIQMKEDRGNVRDITGRCVDITEYCCQALNVSPAILNNVLFCHQENSSWPLDEAQKLKLRFDEIFDAVKYNKCVETLRKLHKTKADKIKIIKVELKTREENKERAENLKARIDDRIEKLSNIQDEVGNKKEELVPIENRMKEILELEDSLGVLQNKLTAKQQQKKGLVDQQVSIKKHISFLFDGTDEELQEKINTFESEKQNDEKFIQELSKRQDIVDNKMLELRKNIQKYQVKIGQFKEEKRQQAMRIEEREETISKARNDLQIQNSCYLGKMEESQDIINELKSVLEGKQMSLDELIMGKEADELELQKNINDLIEKHSKTKQDVFSKNAIITDCQKKIKDFDNKLADLVVKDKLMKSANDKLEEIQRTLYTVADSVDEKQVTREIEDSSDEIANLERQLEKLDSEYRVLQQNNLTLEMIEKEKESVDDKKSKVNQLKNKHCENLFHIFDDDVPDENISLKVNQILEKDDRKLKFLNEKIATMQKKITALEIEIKNKKKDIAKNEANLAAKQKKVEETCKGEELQNLLSKTELEKEKLQKFRGQYRSAKVMYEAYINKFEEKSPCCPICETDFSSKNDVVRKIISTLKSKIKDIPKNLADVESNLKKTEEFYNKLQQLTPIHKEIEALNTKILPELNQDLGEFTMQLDALSTDLAIAKSEIEEPQKNVTICRSMISDVALIDQYLADIKKSEASIQNLEGNIVTVLSDRSRQETEAEIDNIKGKLSDARQKCETNKKKLERHRNRVQELRTEKDKALQKHTALQIATQEKPHLEKQKNEYTETLNKARTEVQNLTVTEKKLNSELNEAKENKRIACQKNKQILQSETTKLSDSKKLVDQIVKLQSVIDDYIKKEVDVKLVTAENDLDENTSKESELSQTKQKILDAISSKKQYLAKEESNFRALQDNILLREKTLQEKKLTDEIEALQKQIGNHNYRSVYEEKQKLEKKKEIISREINTIEGQKQELLKTLKEFKAELEKPVNKNAYKEFKRKYYELQIAEMLQEDLMKYTIALEKSVLQFHKDRMVHINKLIRELWRAIYRGNDIDYIEIQTEDAIGTNAKRRSYSYKVVQVKKGVEIEMRGRCSAGQRVLACLVIRMALAETFSSHCGILALDEPTTNLDRQNILSLSDALVNLIESRKNQKNFQLLIITHDEEFLNTLTRVQSTPHYWRVSRNEDGFSVVKKVTT